MLIGAKYASGFTPVTQTGVEAQLNATNTVNIKLEVGAVTTSVSVEAAAAAIDTTTAQVQNVFEAKTVTDLPVASVGLGVLNLSLLNAVLFEKPQLERDEMPTE